MKKIKIIGMGGIGTCLYPELYRYLEFLEEEFEITLIDGDIYEDGNKPRQYFSRLGPKAEVTAEMYSSKFPDLFFKAENVYINEENAIYLLEENDIVLMCVDNHVTRKQVADACEELHNISLISGGNHLTTGDVMWYLKRDGVELTPELDNIYHPELQNPTDRHPEDIGCDELVPSRPQLLATNNLVSAVMFNLTTFLLEDFDAEKVTFNMIYVDIVSGNSRSVMRNV